MFDLPNGVNEFDLIYDGSNYHLFYDDRDGDRPGHLGNASIRRRSASTIAGLSSATDDAARAGRYPGAYYDGSTWHLWTYDQIAGYTKHYTCSTAGGSYTLSDTFAQQYYLGVSVAQGANGLYYMVGEDDPNHKIQVFSSPSLAGPWTRLGYTFPNGHPTPWASVSEFDPFLLFSGGYAYVAFSSWDGSRQRICITTVDPLTIASIGDVFMLREPTDAWEMLNADGKHKIFNPVWLNGRLYYSQNPSVYDTPAGWGYIEI